MVVATLLATMVFASTFTIPDGNKEDTGASHFLQNISFIMFASSQEVSLILSSISILSFLSIVTSNYKGEYFFSVLLENLVVEIASLFLSVASMMVVLCATCFIVFNGGTLLIPILITVLAFIPVLFLFENITISLLRQVIPLDHWSICFLLCWLLLFVWVLGSILVPAVSFCCYCWLCQLARVNVWCCLQ